MHTLGVDLAAEPAKTALALVEWTGGAAVVRALRLGATDDEIIAAAKGVGRIGIDAPFGWPVGFVDFVAAHHAGHPPAMSLASRADRRPLTKRRTDLVVQQSTGIVPLSVSADRIAHVALRCAGLLARLGEAGVDVDRVDGTAVEVYPAAALRRWGLPYRGYKGGAAGLAASVRAVEAAAPWLDLGRFGQVFAATDDAFDSVISALIARAAAIGRTVAPTIADRVVAVNEGWIHLPDGPLAELPDRTM